MTTEPTEGQEKEGRIARDVRMALHLGKQPSALLPLLRTWMVKLWASRGGGYYGLGYVVTFAVLEAKSLAGSMTSASGIAAQAVQYVFKFSVDSFLNVVYALIWPVWVIQWLGNRALVVLVLGYFAFEVALRPLVEAWSPEIKAAAAQRERRKQEKLERKRAKRARSSD